MLSGRMPMSVSVPAFSSRMSSQNIPTAEISGDMSQLARE